MHWDIIVNTSFNCAGEPLVETLTDAARSFRKMNFDYLVTEADIYRSTQSGEGPQIESDITEVSILG
jgi:predicted NodU family carbamoyl transferase